MQIPNQHGTNQEDLKITRDEFKKIEKAMKKPEFAELMGDYMKEISDPKNREEYDQYLKQLEKESELPKGMQLIKPEPHFCIKTTIWSKQNRKHEQKFFINVCSTSVIDKPSFQQVKQNGQSGQNWQIPYSIGKIRYDQDKKQHVCNTVDVAFHPHTIGYCYKMPQFKNLVCSTALEASTKQLGERNEDISKDFKVLKNTKCKGGEPALLPVRIDKKGKLSNELDDRQGGQANAKTKLEKDITQMKEEHQKQKQEHQKEQIDEEDIEEPKESDEITSTAIQQPKYRFIYSYPVDYSDFLDSRPNQPIKLPNQLGCDIKLPKVSIMKDILLNLSNDSLVLDVPQKYFLDIKLPYLINQTEATAKFEQKNKTLKIKAPISIDYLKQRYQEEFQKLKELENNNDNDTQQIEEEQIIQQEVQVQFIPENENKILIEEISNQIQQQEQNNQDNELQIQDKKQEQFIQLNYNQRQDGNSLFVIIKIKSYNKENINIQANQNEICLLNKFIIQDCITYQFLHLNILNSKNEKIKLNINYVTDFIILQLESVSQDISINNIDYTNQPFNSFLQKIDILRDEKIKLQEQEQQEQQEQQQKLLNDNNKIQFETQTNDEDDIQQQYQQSLEQEYQQQLQEQQKTISKIQQQQINIKKNIQFLKFQEILPELYEID